VLPRLHLVTDDVVLRAPAFPEAARSILAAHGAAVALHLRGHGLGGGELFRLAALLAPVAAEAGALLLVNDRTDLALAAGAGGVQLGRRSLPLAAARRLLGAERRLGYSAHSVEEVRRAEAAGADYLIFGTIFPSATHPGEATAGVEGLRRAAHATTLPLLAIGGLTPARMGEVRAAGAYGVAVLGGVWHAKRPEAAADAFQLKIEEEWS
jgi:thiamine-phosphate pyrophosphorylase